MPIPEEAPKTLSASLILNHALVPPKEMFDASRTKAKDGSNRGRIPGLTAPVFEFILQCVAEGIPESYIGPMLNPPHRRDIVWVWKKHGERDIQAKKRTIYTELIEGLRACAPLQEESNIAVIASARAKDWRAAAWLAERNNPAKFGKTLRVGGDPSNPEPIRVEVTFVDAVAPGASLEAPPKAAEPGKKRGKRP